MFFGNLVFGDIRGFLQEHHRDSTLDAVGLATGVAVELLPFEHQALVTERAAQDLKELGIDDRIRRGLGISISG